MAVDLFEKYGIDPNQGQNRAPVDLFEARGISPSMPEPVNNRNTLQRLSDWAERNINQPMGHLTAGLGRGIEKGASTLGNYMYRPVDALLGTNLRGKLKAEQEAKQAAFDKQYGDSSIARLGQFVGDLAAETAVPFGAARKIMQAGKLPAMLTKTPLRRAMTEGAIGLGALSHMQDPTNPMATIVGAALGAGGGIVGRGAEKGLDLGRKYYIQSAFPGLIEKATEKVGQLADPSYYARLLKGRHGAQQEKTREAYKALTEEAKRADKLAPEARKAWGYNPKAEREQAKRLEASRPLFYSSGFKKATIDKAIDELKKGRPVPDDMWYQFRPEKFIKAIKKERSALKRKIGNDAGLQEKYGETLSYLDEWLANPPKTFMDALRRQEAINYAPQSYEIRKNAPADDFLRGVVGKARQGLKESFRDSALGTEIGTLYPRALQEYQNLQKFYQAPAKSGELRFNRTLAEGMKGKQGLDAAVLGEFLPKVSQTGTAGLEHLGNLLGDPKKMQEAAKSYYLRRATDDLNYGKDVFDLYSKLSPQQRQLMFGQAAETPYLAAAEKSLKQLGDFRKAENKVGKKGLQYMASHYGPPAIIGTAIGKSLGLPWEESLGLGASFALGIGKMKESLPKLLQKRVTPEKILKNLEKLEKTGKIKGTTLNALMGSSRGNQYD